MKYFELCYLSPSLISAPTSGIRNLGGMEAGSLGGDVGLGIGFGGLRGVSPIGSTCTAPGSGALEGDCAEVG